MKIICLTKELAGLLTIKLIHRDMVFVAAANFLITREPHLRLYDVGALTA
jgi:hypothetical protein